MKTDAKHIDFSLDGNFKQKLLTDIKDKFFNALNDDELGKVSAAGDIDGSQKSGIKPLLEGEDD